MMSVFDYELRNMLTKAAELGATKALTETGAVKPYLNKSEAYRMYGRGVVDGWIKDGLLTPRGDTYKSWRIDRVEIQALAASRTVAEYINSQYFKNKGAEIKTKK
ncbi:hypothetical protein [Sphingobacterium psychroaquaticum]|uniref:Uncharacterized protein n=1 Tax=Sphingobacterium psychroaquaticum TaxID=561061 RepID=A0A1X7JTH8_9SPHI|nr:hypothetical protein [Sphingobacterium psychroaquaticum]SMG31706.1 hypothetical protein SAMN05660862_2214 [Sphingobacterium psychroaquaticum]